MNTRRFETHVGFEDRESEEGIQADQDSKHERFDESHERANRYRFCIRETLGQLKSSGLHRLLAALYDFPETVLLDSVGMLTAGPLAMALPHANLARVLKGENDVDLEWALTGLAVHMDPTVDGVSFRLALNGSTHRKVSEIAFDILKERKE